jgi:hypothetical protein
LLLLLLLLFLSSIRPGGLITWRLLHIMCQPTLP